MEVRCCVCLICISVCLNSGDHSFGFADVCLNRTPGGSAEWIRIDVFQCPLSVQRHPRKTGVGPGTPGGPPFGDWGYQLSPRQSEAARAVAGRQCLSSFLVDSEQETDFLYFSNWCLSCLCHLYYRFRNGTDCVFSNSPSGPCKGQYCNPIVIKFTEQGKRNTTWIKGNNWGL